jgi:hypothetical protein
MRQRISNQSRLVVRPTALEPLLALLAATTADTLTLTLVEIEAMIGRSLPDGAFVDQTPWRSELRTYVRSWKAMGWEAWLDREGQRVTWTRLT